MGKNKEETRLNKIKEGKGKERKRKRSEPGIKKI
jgi:hypothetical protein